MAAVVPPTNGVNGHADGPVSTRFSDIPAVIDIPVGGTGSDEAVNLDLTELLDETDELCDLLENENAARNYWITIALAYVKQKKVAVAVDILEKGLKALQRGRSDDRLALLSCLCWLTLWRVRNAPRVRATGMAASDKTKEEYLKIATTIMNDALRISPSHPSLSLARGVIYLLRCSLQPVTRTQEVNDRTDMLRQANKCFDDALRLSQNKNLMALLGKARSSYSLLRFPEALALYQQALERAPDMIDPDPRIGIGACYWSLGHKQLALQAWQRSLDLNPHSTIANILLGLYHLDEASQFPTTDAAFAPIYKKAMTTYTQTAFKLDDMHALTCCTFGGYFLLRKTWGTVEKLAKRAIERADVNAIASDGWYLLARKEHFEGDLAKAAEFYAKADQARGGEERGYLPAKFGAAQLKTLMKDFDGAKFRLDKLLTSQHGKGNVEAMTLLGVLHAEEVFATQVSGAKGEDKSLDRKKAIGLLEQVRIAWKDPKKKITPDSSVLLNLARLYEHDQPEKAISCLQQVEQMELEEIPEEDIPEGLDDEVAEKQAMRELLSPQLLNNIGCFHFQGGQFVQANEDFRTALEACVKLKNRDDGFETDALVTTISFNLARTHEAEGMFDEAKSVYTSLLRNHPEYIDAHARLAYIALRERGVLDEGAVKGIKNLMENDPSNLDIRSLYGWYINKAKKRTLNLGDDLEQKHYKATLMSHDKHDLYALTAMGNLHLQIAREMPRDTDQNKDRRSKVYIRAVEFFDKVLSLDPKNAYAAQGLGIALAEEKKDINQSIQVFSKVRESVRDASVHINLGHVFTEVKQFSRAIENYELALARGDNNNANVLACLGRVWLLKGRQEKNLPGYKEALAYAERGLEQRKDDANFKFNVAFVKIQIAQLLNGLPEAQKTSADVETAQQGLDEAIDAFTELAKGPNPPFPARDLEARANMGRNTMKRQLAGAAQRQQEYEAKNAEKLGAARKQREEELRKREEVKKRAEEEVEEQKRKIAEERAKMADEDRELISRRMEEDRVREEADYTDDPETGERKKKERRPKAKGEKKRKKRKGEDSDDDDAELFGESDGDSGKKSRTRSRATSVDGSGGDQHRRKKKRRLEKKGKAVPTGKFKSSEMVEDSSEEEDADAQAGQQTGNEVDSEMEDAGLQRNGSGGADEDQEEEEEETGARTSQRKKLNRVLDDDDDDEENGEADDGHGPEAGNSDGGGDADEPMGGDPYTDNANVVADEEGEPVDS
ncbi:HCP-like protein [Polychaeton citri CBS 116435]|uniref:HCP-like protein n=1 Tax=Polychaeton citri CBS 116435 TaxID=1314669 RepID=A0A9P4Q5T2_9PEZI|nr:HCP-like protein [Polychaeton citri CBS 116435]